MADFRRPSDLQDPRLKEVRVLKTKTLVLDLWSGADLSVSLDSEASVTFKEMKAVGLPKDRRRFELIGKELGSGRLVAFKGPLPWVWPLTVTVPKPPTKAEFIQKLRSEGSALAKQYKIPVSIMIGQAILESLAGSSDLALVDNILYGITKRKELTKGQEPDWYPAARQIALHTTIAIAGNKPTPDLFCAADSYAQAVEIWAQYVTKHPHTKNPEKLFKGPPWSDADRQAIADLMPKLMFGKGNTNYPQELMAIIKENGLAAYD